MLRGRTLYSYTSAWRGDALHSNKNDELSENFEMPPLLLLSFSASATFCYILLRAVFNILFFLLSNIAIIHFVALAWQSSRTAAFHRLVFNISRARLFQLKSIQFVIFTSGNAFVFYVFNTFKFRRETCDK